MELSFDNETKNFIHDLHDRYQVWKNRIEWKLNGEFHRVNGPAIPYQYFQKGKCHSLDSASKIFDLVNWYVNGIWHKVNHPAAIRNSNEMFFCLYGRIYAYKGNNVISYRNGITHHDSACAMITGNNFHWKINNLLHREDGPAVIYADGTQEWYIKGELHREDGPAVICKNGTQEFWINGQLHREDGPAVIYADGTQEWYIKGQLHRIDGPAIIKKDGSQEFWIQGNKKDF